MHELKILLFLLLEFVTNIWSKNSGRSDFYTKTTLRLSHLDSSITFSSVSKVECSFLCQMNGTCEIFQFNETKNECHIGKYPYISSSVDPVEVYIRDGASVKIVPSDCEPLMSNLQKYNWSFVCEKDSSNTAWIIIQRRVNGTVTFDKTWSEYKNGFGHPDMGFWFGNEKIHQLTTSHPMKVRFDLLDKDDIREYVDYSTFEVAGEEDKYKLTISGYSGNIGDGMRRHNGMMFSTKDQENDQDSNRDCSNTYGRGGWWYKNCYSVNLNGEYLNPGTINGKAISWDKWHHEESLKKSEIKITFK